MKAFCHVFSLIDQPSYFSAVQWEVNSVNVSRVCHRQYQKAIGLISLHTAQCTFASIIHTHCIKFDSIRINNNRHTHSVPHSIFVRAQFLLTSCDKSTFYLPTYLSSLENDNKNSFGVKLSKWERPPFQQENWQGRIERALSFIHKNFNIKNRQNAFNTIVRYAIQYDNTKTQIKQPSKMDDSGPRSDTRVQVAQVYTCTSKKKHNHLNKQPTNNNIIINTTVDRTTD